MENQTSNSTEYKREKALADTKMWLANDWNLKEETPEAFVLTKNTQSIGMHVLIFLIAGWWTAGIANLCYYFASKKTKKILK